MDDLESNISTRNKRKGVSKKKKIAGLVKYDRELVEKKKKEKILVVWASTYGRILRNTRKI